LTRKITWLLAAIVSVNFSQMAFACNDSNNKTSTTYNANTQSNLRGNFFNKLDLTPKQQTQINAIRTQANITRIKEEKDLLSIHSEIENIVMMDKIDEAKLDKLLDQKKDIMLLMIKSRIKVRHQVYNILTDKQKVKYNQMIQEWEKVHLQKIKNMQHTITS